MKPRSGLILAALTGMGAFLAGCADEKAFDRQFSSLDLTSAVHEDMAAQIADPDARYKGPPPPSNGPRAQVAHDKYKQDKVTPPNTESTRSVGGGG